MHTFEEVANYLDDIIDSLPSYIPQSLPGGIYLIPEVKHHPILPFPQYVVMGEYIRDSLGARIHVYYNSVMARYIDASEEDIKKVLRDIVLHEFQHHFEMKAGCRDLEIEDENFVIKALNRLRKQKKGGM